MSSKLKITIAVLVVAAVGGAAYYFFVYKPKKAKEATTGAAGTVAVKAPTLATAAPRVGTDLEIA